MIDKISWLVIIFLLSFAQTGHCSLSMGELIQQAENKNLLLIHPDNLQEHYDIVVLEGTAAGVGAAISAARQGKRVLLIESTNRIGGMITNGLGVSDLGIAGLPQSVSGGSPNYASELSFGLFDVFRKKVVELYGLYEKDGHYYCKDSEYCDDGEEYTRGVTHKEVGFSYEPEVAMKALVSAIDQELRNYSVGSLSVLFGYRLSSVELNNKRINTIGIEKTDSPDSLYQIKGDFFIDSTDCGDLAVASGYVARIDRESREEYNEIFAGNIKWNLKKENFFNDFKGEGDNKTQAYSYFITVERKDAYSSIARYAKDEPVFSQKYYNENVNYDKNINKYKSGKIFNDWWPYSVQFPRKRHEINVHPNGADLQEINYSYPNGKTGEETLQEIYSNRKSIEKTYKQHAIAYIHYLQEMCNPDTINPNNTSENQDDKCSENNYLDIVDFPERLYVRECRRIKGMYIFTQHDATPFNLSLNTSNGDIKTCEYDNNHMIKGCSYQYPSTERPPLHRDSIGITTYAMDSHAVDIPDSNYDAADEEHKGNGEFYISKLTGVGDIPLRILIPDECNKAQDCPENILVSHAVSATHVGYGTLRMEPVRMNMGQAAGVAAALALEKNKTAKEIVNNADLLVELQEKLIKDENIVIHFYEDLLSNHDNKWAYPAVQILSTWAVLQGYLPLASEKHRYLFKPYQGITRAEFAKMVLLATNQRIKDTYSKEDCRNLTWPAGKEMSNENEGRDYNKTFNDGKSWEDIVNKNRYTWREKLLYQDGTFQDFNNEQNSGHWFHDYVAEAYNRNFFDGFVKEKINGKMITYNPPKFKAEQKITKAEAIKMVLESFGLYTEDETKPTPWYKNYTAQAKQKGISCNDSNMGSTIDRMTAAVLVYRGYLVKSGRMKTCE